MVQIHMTSVTSSNIKAVGYDSGSKTLRVDFKDGGSYEYDEVSEDVAESLKSADSVGKYFTENIRGQYGHRQVS